MNEEKKRILEAVRGCPQGRPSEIVGMTGLSRSVVQKYLKELLDGGYAVKRGAGQSVRYEAVPYASECMQESFLYKDAYGSLLFGIRGFTKWAEECSLSGENIEERVAFYEESMRQYDAEKRGGPYFVLDIRGKLEGEKLFLDEVLCRDLYTVPVGNRRKRTKMAVLIEVVKGSGNREKLKKLIAGHVESAVRDIYAVIRERKIDAVAFIPPTANRPVQIMNLLKKEFIAMNVDRVPVLSISRHFPDPYGSRQEQKHIRSVGNRIANARNSYRVKRVPERYGTVLLIDDLVGSGATLNEVARQCREGGIAESVCGLCLVGVNAKKLVVVRKA